MAEPIPTKLNLRQASRLLEVSFDDGRTFSMPCEYLRVFSPSAEERVAGQRGALILGKENVNITDIEPVGNYAVRLKFDDGHDSGVFSWKTLYGLGRDHDKNWSAYLERRSAERAVSIQASATTRIRVLYFAWLVERLGAASEGIELTGSDQNVATLLSTLRERGEEWALNLAEDAVKLTVNKQFVSPDTPLRDDDEVAIVPLRRA